MFFTSHCNTPELLVLLSKIYVTKKTDAFPRKDRTCLPQITRVHYDDKAGITEPLDS